MKGKKNVLVEDFKCHTLHTGIVTTPCCVDASQMNSGSNGTSRCSGYATVQRLQTDGQPTSNVTFSDVHNDLCCSQRVPESWMMSEKIRSSSFVWLLLLLPLQSPAKDSFPQGWHGEEA